MIGSSLYIQNTNLNPTLYAQKKITHRKFAYEEIRTPTTSHNNRSSMPLNCSRYSTHCNNDIEQWIAFRILILRIWLNEKGDSTMLTRSTSSYWEKQGSSYWILRTEKWIWNVTNWEAISHGFGSSGKMRMQDNFRSVAWHSDKPSRSYRKWIYFLSRWWRPRLLESSKW
jgi:hypothetical protein